MSYIMFTAATDFEAHLPFYLVGVGIKHQQEHVIRPYGYPYLQWIQCRKGCGQLLIGGKSFTVQERQGMLLFSNVPHEYYAVTASWEVAWVTIGGFAAEQSLYNGGISQSAVLSVLDPELFLLRAEKLHEMAKSYNSLNSLECSKIIYSLLMDILAYTATPKVESRLNQYSKLKPVFDYIESNYKDIITLENLSEVANLTPQYFCSLFKKTTGIRVFEYINSVRIKKSKEMLIKNKDMAVKDIALTCGYDDVSYFCSIFKKQEKLTPLEFRKLHGV
ncbi:AraC family transcriptional regulator [Clostridium thermarum]|uniref:AraC family transcriptional regulator n=1 Tax=Clostridium thermarum TaxID=1716543 RepID=UPI00111D5F8E|nr:AraC family transcriptional regulator [Clostridium thermarum]